MGREARIWHPAVTVFFNLPADYNGSTPVKLSFTDASGKLVRSFTLHLKKKAKPEPPSENPAVTRKRSEEKATAATAGMNHFQWDLTYPDAVDVKGIYNSFFAAAPPVGPEVMPGTYYATLTYGDGTQKAAVRGQAGPDVADHAGGTAAAVRSAHADSRVR